MRKPTETFMVVVLSTGHVTKETAEALDELVTDNGRDPDHWSYWIVAARWSAYGWWVWANVEDGRDDLPADLRACLDFAQRHGAKWVLFDCDGPFEPDLARYDW